jgi:hypothetical protein
LQSSPSPFGSPFAENRFHAALATAAGCLPAQTDTAEFGRDVQDFSQAVAPDQAARAKAPPASRSHSQTSRSVKDSGRLQDEKPDAFRRFSGKTGSQRKARHRRPAGCGANGRTAPRRSRTCKPQSSPASRSPLLDPFARERSKSSRLNLGLVPWQSTTTALNRSYRADPARSQVDMQIC